MDVIKEMEDNNQSNYKKGIDIAVSILKQDYPFILDWDYKYNPDSHRTSVHLLLTTDMKGVSEFYNSPIRFIYVISDHDTTYPFTPLELALELNEDQKYDLFRELEGHLQEIYDEIPDEYKFKFFGHASNMDIPRELMVDGFRFEKPKENINESKTDEIERNLSAINSILSEISWEGLCEVWVEYNDTDKDYEIRSKSTKRHFNSDEIFKELGYLDNTIRSMGLSVYIFTPWYVENCEDEPEFLNESKKESKKELIETILNTMVLPEYDHVICGFEVKEPHERFDTLGNTPFKFMSVTVTFIGGPGTKLWPQTPGIQDMYEDILNEVWDVIYNYTNEGVDVYHKTVKDCGKKNIYLRESKESVRGSEFLDLIKTIVEIFKSEYTICDIEVDYNEDDEMYVIMIVFDSDELLKIRDRGLYARQIRNRIGEEIVKYIPDFMNYYVGSYVRHCKEPITEGRIQVPSSQYNSLEKIINLEMSDKYDWWKDIKINYIENVEFSKNHTLIEAEVTVDEEWGGNQWNEYNPHMEFPGNKGWEPRFDNYYERVSLGDIIGTNLAYDIREILADIFTYTLNFETEHMSFRNLMLIFE
jgi:hypothetical protein